MFENCLTQFYIVLHIACCTFKTISSTIFLPTLTLENVFPNVNDSNGILITFDNMPDKYYNIFENVFTIIYIYQILSILVSFAIIWVAPNLRAMWISNTISIILDCSSLIVNLSIIYSGNYKNIMSQTLYIYAVTQVILLFIKCIFSSIMCCMVEQALFFKRLYNPSHIDKLVVPHY